MVKIKPFRGFILGVDREGIDAEGGVDDFIECIREQIAAKPNPPEISIHSESSDSDSRN